MIELWGEALTGPMQGEFPLLLKLLDAKETLSVQVHPGDEYGMAHEGKLGKSEAWVVLNAEPGAKIAYGLDLNGGDLRARRSRRAGSRARCTGSRSAPATLYYIPNGTVHALGAGIQVYEIQQSSGRDLPLLGLGPRRQGRQAAPAAHRKGARRQRAGPPPAEDRGHDRAVQGRQPHLFTSARSTSSCAA